VANYDPDMSYDGGHLASVARVRDLGDEQRAGSVRNVAAKAHDDSSAVEHGIAAARVLLYKSLNQSTNNDTGTSEGSALLPSKTVGKIWSQRQREDASKTGDGAVQTEAGTGRLVEDCCKSCEK
jgi:hypothetical protein